MKVLVDTSIWSLALRRGTRDSVAEVRALRQLIVDFRAQLIGPVRQELLSGIRDDEEFERLRGHLAAFPDIPLRAEDFELAAAFFNRCRRAGVQGSNTDFLICAVAAHRGWAVYTADRDFARYAEHVPLQRYDPRGA